MKLPRWTTYPALLVLSGALWMGVPRTIEDPNVGAAAAVRASVSPTTYPRLVILGVDGLDPDLLADAIRRFPERTKNFQDLVAAKDGIQNLGTSNPPQSPVAWSNFITGMNPGGHGIYDFIHRDLTTRMIKSPISNDEQGTEIHIPGTTYKMPWGGASEPNRTGQAFWELLAEHDVPADVWRMPINYPVTAGKGVSFPGMMTPAVDSAYGEATLYTTNVATAQGNEGRRKQLRFRDEKCQTVIQGPVNSFKDDKVNVTATEEVDGESVEKTKQVVVPAVATVPLTIYRDMKGQAAALIIDGKAIVLKVGQWSDFVSVNFSMLPMGASDMAGIVRFYLRSVGPDFEMYMSPVNMDPIAPAAVISEPQDASAWLAGEIGLYYTQGMAEDVGALKHGLIDEEEFMQQTGLVFDERGRMLDVALERYLKNDEGGLLFFYYSTVDLASHMMWRLTDSEHPHYDAELAGHDSSAWSGRPGSTWQDTVTDLILRMDPVLGEIRERVGTDTAIVVMSDHGFAPYRRKFDLNSWLYDNGYLVLKEGWEKELPIGAEGFREVHLALAADWTKTRAYGIGFNGLYLNLKGRELDDPATKDINEGGIVQPGAEADALLAELKAKLEAVVDPKDGGRPILRCDLGTQVYSGTRVPEAPGLVVGYNSGYGNSDEASLGRVTNTWLSDNLGGTFNGSHLMCPDVVAGILLTNQKLAPGAHDLPDVTAAVLDFYGVDVPADMVGVSAFD